MTKIASVSAAVFLLAVPRLHAQDLPDLCRVHRRFTAGQWASYRLTEERAQRDSQTMKFAIVGVEGAGDAARLIYEMSFQRLTRGKLETTVLQMLVSGLGTPTLQVHRFVMKSGDSPAMQMPDMMISMMNRQMTANIGEVIANTCAQAQVVGWESVTVPAGTFRALHVRNPDGAEAWVTRDVPFGMVQVKNKNGSTMVLTGRGRDAKTMITEQPREMMGGRRP